MKVLSSIKVNEEKMNKLLAVQPEMELVQVKEFIVPDDQVEVLLTYGWDVKEDTLDLFPNLKWVQSLSAGVDMLPLKKLAERDIILTNVRGAHKIQMAEHIVWSMLMILRQGKTFVHLQDDKVFSAKPKLDEMYGKTVCVVGAGTIGKEVAMRCAVFGMRVLGISRSGGQEEGFERIGTVKEMPEILGQSDIVVVVLPLTAKTKGFVNKEFLSSMKEGSILINVARGPVADEDALLQALQEGRIKSAALDVFVKEPLPEDSPFWEMENVLVTPHIGGRTMQASERMWDVFVQNLSKYPNLEDTNKIDYQEQY